MWQLVGADVFKGGKVRWGDQIKLRNCRYEAGNENVVLQEQENI
jgi:hypothetical protein